MAASALRESDLVLEKTMCDFKTIRYGFFTRLLGAFAIVLAAQLLAAPSSFACGDIRYWTDAYQDKRANDQGRRKALEHIIRICDGYEAVKSDRVLLTIVADALSRPYETRLIQRLFDKYRCLSGARSHTSYAGVASQLDDSHCPSATDLARWQVVNVRRANVRRAPKLSGALAGGLARGTVVVPQGDAGEWTKIKSWKGLTGYVHGSLLTPFSSYSPE